jgi:hypothetical protein
MLSIYDTSKIGGEVCNAEDCSLLLVKIFEKEGGDNFRRAKTYGARYFVCLRDLFSKLSLIHAIAQWLIHPSAIVPLEESH